MIQNLLLSLKFLVKILVLNILDDIFCILFKKLCKIAIYSRLHELNQYALWTDRLAS